MKARTLGVKRPRLEGDQRTPWQESVKQRTRRIGAYLAITSALTVLVASALSPVVAALFTACGIGAMTQSLTPRASMRRRPKWAVAGVVFAAAGSLRALAPAVASAGRGTLAAVALAVAWPAWVTARTLVWPPSAEKIVEADLRSVWPSIASRWGIPDASLLNVKLNGAWLWLTLRFPWSFSADALVGLEDQLRHTGAQEHRVDLAADRDPSIGRIGLRFGRAVTFTAGPWVGMETNPAGLNAITIGVRRLGADQTAPYVLDARGKRVLVLGLPGSGKTTLMRTVLAHAALSDNVQVWSTDLAGDLEPFRQVAHRWAANLQDARVMLTDLMAEAHRRSALLAQHGYRELPISDELPEILVALDEIATLLRTDADSRVTLGTISSLNRKIRMGVVMTSHRPVGSWIPADVSQLASHLITFKLGRRDGQRIWGPDHPLKTWQLTPGQAFVAADGGDPVKVAMHQLSDDDVDWCCARAAALHSPATHRGPVNAGILNTSPATPEEPPLSPAPTLDELAVDQRWPNPRLAAAYMTLGGRQSWTAAKYAVELNVSKATAERLLGELEALGAARRDRSARTHLWSAAAPAYVALRLSTASPRDAAQVS